MKKNYLDKKFNFLIPIQINDIIRIGSQNDGGYIISERSFKRCDNLISFGMASNFDFEFEFLNQGKSVHAYDFSVSKKFYILNFFKYLKRFIFFKSDIKSLLNKKKVIDNYNILIKNKNFIHFQKRINSIIEKDFDITIDEVFKKTNSLDNFLAIDIEGFEYKIIDNLMKYEKNIAAMTIEFHNIEKNIDIFVSLVNKIKSYFHIIHLHGNNYSYLCNNGLPNVLEISFLSKKKFENINLHNKVYKFPIKDLDKPNNFGVDDLSFEFNLEKRIVDV